MYYFNYRGVGIIKYIIDSDIKNINFNLIKNINNKTNNNKYLYKYKNIYNSNILFNHIIYLKNTNNCKQTICKAIYNYKKYDYFLIIFVYKNNFLLINKNKINKEFYFSKNIKYFNKLLLLFNL